MKIIHNIALSVNESAKKDFAAIDIVLEEGFSNFKIDESNNNWPKVQELAKTYEAIDTVVTSFSAKELREADYLRMVASWHHGYPEPSDEFGYLSEVYDLDSYCAECGKGIVQKAPFRFGKEPKWGAKQLLQLNWVFDEFFVKPEFWEKVFKPYGVKCREVLHVKTGKKLGSVVQLIIPEEKIHLSLDEYPTESCSLCSSVKYSPISRGFFPALNGESKMPIFKASDIFGSGNSVQKAVIVSRELYSSILENKLKGVEFIPLAE